MKNFDKAAQENINIILLNWNAPHELIECHKNIREYYEHVNVVIVDNNSTDDSISLITEYLRQGNHDYRVYSEEGLERDLRKNILIKNNKNYGFAGGNNIAIRFIFNVAPNSFIWMLNSDARIDKNALPELFWECINGDDATVFFGSVICFRDDPKLIQCYGGMKIHPWIGKRSLVMKGVRVNEIYNKNTNISVDVLMGASLFFKTKCIEKIGLMDDRYFMYAEEVDWQLRSFAVGCKIFVCQKSIIYHKASQDVGSRGALYHYYINRASIMLTKRFFGKKQLLFSVVFLSLLILFQNRTSIKKIYSGLRGVKDGLIFKWI